MLGRLIQRFKAKLYRLDTTTMAAGTSYDETFRTVVKKDASGDGIGKLDRIEHAADIVPCQVGTKKDERLIPDDLGAIGDSDLILRFFIPDLVTAGLIEATTTKPLIQIGTRIDSLLDYWTESAVEQYGTTPGQKHAGLFCVYSNKIGWGICMARPTQNLLLALFRDRAPF